MRKNGRHSGPNGISADEGHMANKDSPDIGDRIVGAGPENSDLKPEVPRPGAFLAQHRLGNGEQSHTTNEVFHRSFRSIPEGVAKIAGNRYHVHEMRHFPSSTLVLIISLIAFSACERANDPVVIVEETSLHERAVWSPDGLTIAFTNQIAGGQGIYLIDSTGSNLRLLKAGEGIGLSWSPDARWIVFSANGSLHKIKATGDSLTQLTTSSSDIRPSWSPDGSRIVFRSNGLKILNISTGLITTILTVGNFPTWTPSGSILFATSTAAGINRADYFFETIDTTGGQRQTLFQFRTSTDCGFVSMNSAGTHLLFSARPFDGSERAQIVVINLNSSQVSSLTVDGGDYPGWSPNGANIVYTRTAKGDGGLWIMNADGSNKRRLTQP